MANISLISLKNLFPKAFDNIKNQLSALNRTTAMVNILITNQPNKLRSTAKIIPREC